MRAALRLEAELFLVALCYLTRLSLWRDLSVSDDLMVRSVKYHPAVGALIGALGAAGLVVAATVLPWTTAGVLSLAVTLWVTGAFHESGLAQAVDSWAGGGLAAPDRSRFAVQGGVTLTVVLALKLSVLMSFSEPLAAVALIAGHALGRMASVHVTATTVHLRSEGMRKGIPAVTRDGYRVALAITLITCVPLVMIAGAGATLCGFLGAVLLAQGFRQVFLARLGGYTGDCLGGSQQMGELGAYLGLALWL